VLAGVALIAFVLTQSGLLGSSRSFVLPSRAALGGLGVQQRIVAIANSQVGYRTNPSHSYCNKFSAYWNARSQGCPSGEASEEWCADFAVWAWQKAGVELSYGYGSGELNGGAVSFYEWGVAHGTVTGDPPGRRGPDVINGDGDRTGFSVVETGTDRLRADTGHRGGAPLAGYVSP
jgi:hypothetical protein